MDEVWHPAERWAEHERRAWQERRLREVVLGAITHATALAARMAAAGVAPEDLTLEALRRFPVLAKDALPDAQRAAPPFAGWLGVPVSQTSRLFRSPGPIFDPEGPDEDYWRFAAALFAAGFRPGDVVLNTFSYHLTPAGLMFDGALRALRCPVVPAGPGNTELQVQILATMPIVGYVGTPSFLGTLLETAERTGERVGLRTAFVIAEMLPESLRQHLEARYGLRVAQGYGTADLGCIAYECSRRSGMHIDRDVIVELLDPRTRAPVASGEPGEVVVTALNPIYPLLRFGTGDLAIMDEGPCACGRTGPRLARLLGRVGDAVKVRGMFVHPAEVDRVIARHPEAARYQVVITRPERTDEMLVRVELHADATVSADLRDRLRRSLTEALRLRADVDLVPAGTLPADATKIVDLRTWE